MIPSAASVVRARFWFRVALRAVALAWFVFGVRELPMSLATSAQAAMQGVAFEVSTLIYFLLLVLAAVSLPVLLVLFENRLARWIIPTPKHTCPSCGYPLANLKSPVCPECGDNVRGVAE